MRVVSNILLAASLSAGVGLAERIADPFDRDPVSYRLEVPQKQSEVFYVSSNYDDANGEKHDDRVGDLLLGTAIVSAIGAVAINSGRYLLLAEQAV